MGIEYQIQVANFAAEEAKGILRSLSGFDQVEPEFGAFEYRSNHRNGMPDASASLIENGVYLVAHGGEATAVLAELCDLLKHRFGSIEIREL